MAPVAVSTSPAAAEHISLTEAEGVGQQAVYEWIVNGIPRELLFQPENQRPLRSLMFRWKGQPLCVTAIMDVKMGPTLFFTVPADAEAVVVQGTLKDGQHRV